MTLLERYAAALQARGLADRTIENYRFGLKVLEEHSGKRFTEGLDVGMLEATDVWRFLEERVGDLSQAYLRQIVASSKSWHRWGHSRELWPLNGIMSIPSPRVPDTEPDPLAPSQMLWLITNARTVAQLKLLYLGAWQGCRIHESAAMNEDSWLDDRLDFVGKRGKRREVPIAPAIRDQREICTTPISLRSMRWAYESLRARCPFEWTTHQLRDTFCQRHLDNHIEVEVVENMLGHAPRSTTLRVYGSIPWDRKAHAQGILRIL